MDSLDPATILDRLSGEKYIRLSPSELSVLLDHTETVEEHDTLISDTIRILLYKALYLIQETSNRQEILLRTANSLEAARQFVSERMDIYDKMWDGCGCKVDYYS